MRALSEPLARTRRHEKPCPACGAGQDTGAGRRKRSRQLHLPPPPRGAVGPRPLPPISADLQPEPGVLCATRSARAWPRGLTGEACRTHSACEVSLRSSGTRPAKWCGWGTGCGWVAAVVAAGLALHPDPQRQGALGCGPLVRRLTRRTLLDRRVGRACSVPVRPCQPRWMEVRTKRRERQEVSGAPHCACPVRKAHPKRPSGRALARVERLARPARTPVTPRGLRVRARHCRKRSASKSTKRACRPR